MKRFREFSAFFVILMLIFTSSWSQTQDSYEYESEFTWGINKNTYGGLIGGFVFKRAQKINDRLLESYGLEIMNVKHPQERRQHSDVGNYFIYGKTNYLYALRFQYGRDLILFKKAPQQGVEIKIVTAVGPTIGVLAPYYIERKLDAGQSQQTIREQFHQDLAAEQILGPGRLFEGIDKSKFRLGANAKAALNFELGTIKSQVTGFEVGFLLDSYLRRIELMPSVQNYSMYPTLFFTLFYGGRK